MNWKDRKVLVTGIGVFIASHLIDRLVAESAHVFEETISKLEEKRA